MIRRARHRGFVLLLAVGMVSIVAVLVLLLTMRMHADVRRTRAALSIAQLSQLTLAGVAIVQTSLDQEDRVLPESITLPDSIAERGRLRVEPIDRAPEAVEVLIIAQWDTADSRHRARLERASGGWRMISLMPDVQE